MFHYLAPGPSSFLHFLQQISDASSLSDISFVTQVEMARLEDGRDVVETLYQRLQSQPEIITSSYVTWDLRTMSDIPSDTPWMSLFAQYINMERVMIDFDRPLMIADAESEQLICNWRPPKIIDIVPCRGNLRKP